MIKKSKIFFLFLLIMFNYKHSFAKEQWILDKEVSTINFELPLFLATNVQGKIIDMDGLIEIDLSKQNNNKGIFSVKIESIDINYDKYRDLLLSDVFFDSNKYPIVLIDTKKFTYTNEEKIELLVELQIKNKTKEVPISLEVVRLAEKLVQIKGIFFISRTEFDLGKGKWSSTAVLKDQVKIQISLFLFKE